jgi:transcriptional regulator with XRE-family HTH domain
VRKRSFHVAVDKDAFAPPVGQTQEELAVALGVDLRYLQRIEGGTLNVGLLTVARFAVLLGVPPSQLLRKASLPEPKRGRPKKKTKGR